MKRKEELVAARLPQELVKALKKIEKAEQADRSATMRKLLSRAVSEWEKEYAAKLYGEGRVTLERAAMEADVSIREIKGNDGLLDNKTIITKRIPGQYELKDSRRGHGALLPKVGSLGVGALSPEHLCKARF